MEDNVFWLSVFNTVLYTFVASVLKFALGLWLALLLNQHLPFKAFFRAIVLLPWVAPTALSGLAFWWIYDSQFSIISWSLMQLGLIDAPINFLGDPTNARISVVPMRSSVSVSQVPDPSASSSSWPISYRHRSCSPRSPSWFSSSASKIRGSR